MIHDIDYNVLSRCVIGANSQGRKSCPSLAHLVVRHNIQGLIQPSYLKSKPRLAHLQNICSDFVTDRPGTHSRNQNQSPMQAGRVMVKLAVT